MHVWTTLCLTGLLAACDSLPVDSDEGVGEPVVVELLDANFVRTDGQRRPWEAWLVDMRQRCRACRATESSFPWVRFRLAGDDVPASTVERLQRELRVAGVTRIELESR